MPRYNAGQTSFGVGVTSPRLDGRDDLDQYFRSLRKSLNALPLAHGPITRRSGTRYVTATNIETSRAALIPFEFSTEQAYVVEAGERYMRFFADQGLLSLGETSGLPNTIFQGALASFGQGGVNPPGDGPSNTLTLTGYQPTPDVPVAKTIVAMITGEDSVPGTSGGGNVAEVSSVTHNGEAFTRAVRSTQAVGSAANFAEIWYLHGAADAEANLVITFDRSIIARAVTVVTLLNVDQTSVPVTATADGFADTAVNADITTTEPKSYVAACCSWGVRAGGGFSSPTGINHVELADLDPGADSMTHAAGQVLQVPTAETRNIGFTNAVTQNRSAMALAAFPPTISDGSQSNGVTLDSPYTADEVADIQYAQSTDTMYLVHPNHWPRKLTRLSPTTFSLERVVFQNGQAPFLPENLGSGTLSLSGTTVTAVGTDFDFQPRDIGRYIRWSDDSPENLTLVIARIVTITNAKEVEVEAVENGPVLADVTAAAQITRWSLGMISDSVGFSSVIFHDGRLFYGGGIEQERLIGSVSDSFDDFSKFEETGSEATEEDDRAFVRSCVSRGVNAIRWFVSTASDLFIGTTGQEFRLRPANDDVLTPSSASVRPLTNRGSQPIQPVTIDNNILFAQRGGQKIRNLAFSLASDTFKAGDLSVLAEHLLNRSKTAQRMAFQQIPESIVWVTREDGLLLGLTFEDEQGVLAWHPHQIGGTDAAVESIAVIPTPDTSEDQLWMIVRRTIQGRTRRYVEYMEIQYRPDVDFESSDSELIAALNDAHFIDSALVQDFETPPTSISGLDHLIGETVTITVDGGKHPTRVVDENGAVELEFTGNRIRVGLKYRVWGWTQRYFGGGRIGTDQGQKHRTNRVAMRLFATLGLKVGAGPDGDTDFEDVTFREAVDTGNLPPPLFNGDIDVAKGSGWTDEPVIYFEQDDPYPMTILAIYPRNEVNER